MSENTRNYVHALYGFDATVHRVGPGDFPGWDNASPCEGWSARDVLSHNIGMCQMITGIAHGIGAETAGQPEVINPLEEWRSAFAETREALDDPEALAQKVQTPWGHLVVDRFVGVVTVDPLIHTFDLAVATGQKVVIDEGLAEAGYVQLQKAGDMIRGERFGPEIQLDGNESVVEKLVAMAGRDPLLGSYASYEPGS